MGVCEAILATIANRLERLNELLVQLKQQQEDLNYPLTVSADVRLVSKAISIMTGTRGTIVNNIKQLTQLPEPEANTWVFKIASTLF